MLDIMDFAKSQSFKLIPFFNFVILYFIFVNSKLSNSSFWTTILKCAPIISLILYIFLNGSRSNYKYSQRIVFGLIFSCVGDALLNIDLFPHGMLAFGFAQIFYISAFGWNPLKLFIGIPLYMGGVAVVGITFSSLDQVLSIGLPIYATLLLTMCWRSMARAIYRSDFLVTFCALGCSVFVISDCLIAIDMFYASIPNAGTYIMVTYYFAQFSIALSTVGESQAVKCETICFRQLINKPFPTDETKRRKNTFKD